MQLLEQRVGSGRFVDAYAAVQKQIKARREERKTKLKQDAITNPQAAAARKLKANRKKQAQKKRKIYFKYDRSW